MIKQSTILLLLSFCVAIQAADPRIEKLFEDKWQESTDQSNSENIAKTEPNKELKEDSQQLFTSEEQTQLMQIAQLLLAKNEEITKQNEQLRDDADSVFKKENLELKQDNAQHLKDKRFLGTILAGSFPTAFAAGAAAAVTIPDKIASTVAGINNPNSPLRSQIIPKYFIEFTKNTELNKILAQITACGIKIELGTLQFIEACYQTANQSQKIDLENAQLLINRLAIAMLTQGGVEFDKDKALLKLPDNRTLILNRNQLMQAGCETVAQWLTRKMLIQKELQQSNSNKMIIDMIRENNAPRALGNFAQNIATEVSYNAVAQLIHRIAEKTNNQNNLVVQMLPKEPQNAPYLTRWLVGRGVQAGTIMAAQWIIKRWIRIPFH